MPYPQRPEDRPPGNSKEPRAPLALRLDRAANDVNPILIVMTIGLLLLNLTLYLGMWASRGAIAWPTPHQIESERAPAPPPASLGYGR